ncbi:MAG: hypothetical protein ACYTGU_11305 [Planctomycetota bacterium]
MRAFLFVLWGCLLGGCPPPPPVPSGGADQAKISQLYSLGYDAEEDSIFVNAAFYEGGQALQLTPPSAVTHSVFRLEESTGVPGDIGVYTWYVYSGEGYEEFHQWTWTDTAGVIYVNEFTFTPTYFDDPPSEISRSLGGTVSFLPALREGESVAVYLSAESGEGYAFRAHDVGATTVEIDPEKLDRFDGIVELEIEVWREGTYELQEATPVGGRIQAQHHSAHLPVRLGP